MQQEPARDGETLADEPGRLLSFVVPAHDEVEVIGATLAAIHAAATGAGVRHEIVVVDDASADGTAAIAAAAGADVVRSEARHIVAARNVGAAAARGDLLVFVDADTRIDADVVRAVLAALAPSAACRLEAARSVPATDSTR